MASETSDLTIRTTKQKMPTDSGRGRHSVYNFQELDVGDGVEISVPKNIGIDKVRGRVFASANHFHLKIRTHFNPARNVLTVWRKS